MSPVEVISKLQFEKFFFLVSKYYMLIIHVVYSGFFIVQLDIKHA
jgi:hypothetical protein